jgi:hypothetical protein
MNNVSKFVIFLLLSMWGLGSLIKSGPNEVLSRMSYSEKVAMATEMKRIEQASYTNSDWVDLPGFLKHLLYLDAGRDFGQVRSSAQAHGNKDLQGAIYWIENEQYKIRRIPLLTAIASHDSVFFIVSALSALILTKLTSYLMERRGEPKPGGYKVKESDRPDWLK